MSDVRSSNTIGPTLNFIEAFEELKIDLGNNSAEFKGVGTLDVVSKRGKHTAFRGLCRHSFHDEQPHPGDQSRMAARFPRSRYDLC